MPKALFPAAGSGWAPLNPIFEGAAKDGGPFWTCRFRVPCVWTQEKLPNLTLHRSLRLFLMF